MIKLRREKIEVSNNGNGNAGRDLLNPEPCEPQTRFDSLLRDLLYRIIEREGSVTLDLTNMVRSGSDIDPRPVGEIKWKYGAYTADEQLRESGAEIPFEKISKLEITMWFEPADN